MPRSIRHGCHRVGTPLAVPTRCHPPCLPAPRGSTSHPAGPAGVVVVVLARAPGGDRGGVAAVLAYSVVYTVVYILWKVDDANTLAQRADCNVHMANVNPQ